MPTNVTTTSSPTATEWSASWTGGDPAAYPAEAFTMKCVTRGDTDGCMANNAVSSDPIARDPDSQQSGTLTGLTPGKQYDCYVMVENDVNMACSEKVEYTTAPGVPTNVTLLPVESQPLYRKIAWSNPSYPSNQETITSASITCCFTFGTVESQTTDVCNTQEFTSNWVSNANFDFDYFFYLDPTISPLFTTIQDVRRTVSFLYANAIYDCSVSVCNVDGSCSEASDFAEVSCPADQSLLSHWTPTFPTGNPLADGWFKVGASTQLGTLVDRYDENAGPYDNNTAAFDLFVTTFSFGDVDYLGVGARLEDLFMYNAGNDYFDVDIIRIILDPLPANNFDYVYPSYPSDDCPDCLFDGDYSDNCKTGRVVFQISLPGTSENIDNFYYYDSCSVSTSRDYFPGDDWNFFDWWTSSDSQNTEFIFNMTAIAEYTDRPFTNGWKVYMRVAQDEGYFAKRRLQQVNEYSSYKAIGYSLPFCTSTPNFK